MQLRTRQSLPTRLPWRRLVLALVVGTLLAVPVVRTGSHLLAAHRSPTRTTRVRTTAAGAGVTVEVGASNCGKGWDGAAAGTLSFVLENDGQTAVDASVEDVDSGKIFLGAESLGPGASRPARVTLGAGSYRFVCAGTDAGSVAGPTETVSGDYSGALTPGALPVTDADLVRPLVHYQHWVRSRLPVLHRRLRRLTRDLAAGRPAAARRDWLAAHQVYATLGAAYGAFGAFDAAIDGLPTSGIPPPGDDHLHGFHEIEALLWRGRPTARVLPAARRLGAAVDRLRRHFGTDLAMAPIDLGLRAHEILEDALQVDARGRADAGSHTELAAIAAAVTGTRHALRPLLPLLRPRDPRLAELRHRLGRLERTVTSHHRHGRWTPLARLTRAARMRLDADLDQTVELLSDVAVITDPVRPMPGASS